MLKILIRQDYRFFSNHSGFVANIFYTSNEWERPNNFLIPELLFFLIGQRKQTGDNGQMGYVTHIRLKDHLERFGYVRSDVDKAAQFLLEKELIEADSATTANLSDTASVKATASGWAHMRILSARSEYVASVLPTTPVNDPSLMARVFDLLQIENRHGSLALSQKLGMVQGFRDYLAKQFAELELHPGYSRNGNNGAQYVLKKIEETISFERNARGPSAVQLDWLDT